MRHHSHIDGLQTSTRKNNLEFRVFSYECAHVKEEPKAQKMLHKGVYPSGGPSSEFSAVTCYCQIFPLNAEGVERRVQQQGAEDSPVVLLCSGGIATPGNVDGAMAESDKCPRGGASQFTSSIHVVQDPSHSGHTTLLSSITEPNIPTLDQL